MDIPFKGFLGARAPQELAHVKKRLLEMSSVAENNRIIPAIDNFNN